MWSIVLLDFHGNLTAVAKLKGKTDLICKMHVSFAEMYFHYIEEVPYTGASNNFS